uniref:V-type proton ATPase subunit C n=1 Tax=Pygocentrus nattereri TaxID=42514 RepID=A0A3B4BZP3_PYGNA
NFEFQWDRAKYPTALSLKTVTEIISKQVSQVEIELKSRSTAYNDMKAKLHGLEQKKEGSLQTRTLTGIVKKEDLVLNSEYLTTLLVVVPRSVFTVREFNLEEAEKQRQEMSRLIADKKEQYGTFVRWLKVNFSEMFVAWIHIKALRVFTESVLRYGLPVSFQTLLLQPEKKHAKRLREELNSLFRDLDPTAAASKPDMGVDIPGVNAGQQEYYSYICYSINISLLDSS